MARWLTRCGVRHEFAGRAGRLHGRVLLTTDGQKPYLNAAEDALGTLYFMYHNFRHIHQTLSVTPAMEAGVSDHVWSVEEIIELL